MEGAVDQIALRFRNRDGALQRPVAQRIRIFTDHAFAGAGRIQQNGIEHLRQRRAKHASIEMGQRGVADAAAAEVRMQHFYPAGGIFVSQNQALIFHQRRHLRGFGTGRGRYVHHPIRLRLGGEQRADRQHRAGFLNVKQPAEVFRHAAERQRFVAFFALNPEAFGAPGNRRQAPAVAGRLMQKIRHADFQRIDAQAATQRLLADGEKSLQALLIGQRLPHQIKEGFREAGSGLLGHDRVPVVAEKTGREV